MGAKITCVVNDVCQVEKGLQSEHGLSLWIETENGVLLFDTGLSGQVLLHNLSVLGLDPRGIGAIALSHAHADHTGGLEVILKINPKIPVYAHSDIWEPRYSLRNGNYQSIGLPGETEELRANANFHLSDKKTQILPHLWTTGEIIKRAEPEGRSANHFTKNRNGWQPDPYRDDLSLVLETKNGLVLICGCCHAGLLNTLYHVKALFEKPLRSVIGGTHLITSDKPYLLFLAEKIKSEFPDMNFYLNHCTGETAIHFLSGIFGSRVSGFPAGMTIDLK